MVTIARKQIEDYYDQEWSEVVSSKTLDLLIELTCQSYHLNKPIIPDFVKKNEVHKPQDLGKI